MKSNHNPISIPQYVPVRSHIKGDLANYMANPFEELFPRPYDQKDGVIRPNLGYVADYFLNNNVTAENIQAACIACLTLNSVYLGYPMAIILKADNRMVVEHLLTACKRITPKGRYIEFHQKLTSEELFKKPDSFTNKTIICQSPKGSKDAMHDIQNLISTGCSYRQDLKKSNFGAEYNEVSIKGSIAFIGVEIGDERFDMNHPSILRIPLSANESQRVFPTSGHRNIQSNSGKIPLDILRLRRLFERLSYKQVSIPYGMQISSHIRKQGTKEIINKCIPIQSLLSLLSITNNPPQLTYEEMIGYTIGQNPNEIYSVVNSEPFITATKVEYFLLKLLLKDIIPLKNEHYTPNQISVFEAVERINVGKLSGSTIDQGDKIQILKTLSESSNYWAKLGNIFEKVNSKGRNHMSIKAVEDELNKLAKLAIITKKKFPQISDYGYYINDTSIGKHVTFLDPSEINDPIFNMAQVQVVNPLTGNVETI